MNNSKNAMPRQPADAPACLCESCTCTGCHEECYGHCHGCGSPTNACNSYQTEGAKRLAAEPKAGKAPPEVPAEGNSALAAGTVPAPAAEAVPAPAFDYSGLDAQTAARLQNLARRALESKRRYVLDMMEIVFEAHRELCGTIVHPVDNGKYTKKETVFCAWCASIGISKSTAYKLLQVQALMDNSSPEEQEVLADAPAKLLYAAARPSAPAELVAQVKAGDITTHKQYQELLDELKAREEKIRDLTGQNEEFEGRVQAAEENAKKAEQDSDALRQAVDLANTSAILEKTARKTLEAQRESLLAERDAHLARIAELEARPIGAAATAEDIARWRAEGEAKAREEARFHIDGLTAEAKAANNVCQETRAELQASKDKLKASQREAKRLRETLSGRTDHLEAVEAELKALKARLARAQEALPRMDEPSAPIPSPSAPPALVLCKECIFEPICCGVRLLDEESMSEEMAAGFGSALDEDAFDRRLLGCTAGLTNKESR